MMNITKDKIEIKLTFSLICLLRFLKENIIIVYIDIVKAVENIIMLILFDSILWT